MFVDWSQILARWDDLRSVDLRGFDLEASFKRRHNRDVDVKAVDVRVWFLQVALERRDIEGVVVLVERGTSMYEASIACFKGHCQIADVATPIASQCLPILIAAALWAGRGFDFPKT